MYGRELQVVADTYRYRNNRATLAPHDGGNYYIPLYCPVSVHTLPSGRCSGFPSNRQMLYVGVSVLRFRLLQCVPHILLDVVPKSKNFCFESSTIRITVRDTGVSKKTPVCSYLFHNKDLQHTTMTPTVFHFPRLSITISRLFDLENSQFTC